MAKSDSSVIIYGESGVEKELFAQSIHNLSARRNYNFVAVNCSALPENLLESELYGYEDGAFSGAKKGGKIGLFELAHKVTLFLEFCRSLGTEIKLSEAAKDRVLSHQWNGNIRELKNVVEYLANLGKNIIDESDLPFEEGFRFQISGICNKEITKAEKRAIRLFIMNEGKNWGLYHFILSEMQRSHCNGKSIGRDRLTKKAKEKGCNFTEQHS